MYIALTKSTIHFIIKLLYFVDLDLVAINECKNVIKNIKMSEAIYTYHRCVLGPVYG